MERSPAARAVGGPSVLFGACASQCTDGRCVSPQFPEARLVGFKAVVGETVAGVCSLLMAPGRLRGRAPRPWPLPLSPYQNWNTSPASSKQTAGIPYYFQVHLKRRALTSGLDPAVTPTHFLEVLLGSRAGTQCPALETTGHASAHAQTVLSQAAPGCCLLLPSLGGAHCHLPPATLLWPEAAHGLTC